MRSQTREYYEKLARLSDRSDTHALLEQLDARIALGRAGSQPHLMRANLLRRCGDLSSARAAFVDHLNAVGAEDVLQAFDVEAVIPPGLRSQGGHVIAPMLVIENFLPVDEMHALHRHACDLEPQFFGARTFADAAVYDPAKRRTLVNPQFTYKRQYFLDFLDANLERFQCALGLPKFKVDRVEIKLTNHIEGGFFKPHADNHCPVASAGRAITWLYYFGQTPARFTGGELSVLDTDFGRQEISPSWFTKVEAIPNRLVVFPSWFYHAVGPTHLVENHFGGGRFAVSSHVRKLADTSEWATP